MPTHSMVTFPMLRATMGLDCQTMSQSVTFVGMIELASHNHHTTLICILNIQLWLLMKSGE